MATANDRETKGNDIATATIPSAAPLSSLGAGHSSGSGGASVAGMGITTMIISSDHINNDDHDNNINSSNTNGGVNTNSDISSSTITSPIHDSNSNGSTNGGNDDSVLIMLNERWNRLKDSIDIDDIMNDTRAIIHSCHRSTVKATMNARLMAHERHKAEQSHFHVDNDLSRSRDEVNTLTHRLKTLRLSADADMKTNTIRLNEHIQQLQAEVNVIKKEEKKQRSLHTKVARENLKQVADVQDCKNEIKDLKEQLKKKDIIVSNAHTELNQSKKELEQLSKYVEAYKERDMECNNNLRSVENRFTKMEGRLRKLITEMRDRDRDHQNERATIMEQEAKLRAENHRLALDNKRLQSEKEVILARQAYTDDIAGTSSFALVTVPTSTNDNRSVIGIQRARSINSNFVM